MRKKIPYLTSPTFLTVFPILRREVIKNVNFGENGRQVLD